MPFLFRRRNGEKVCTLYYNNEVFIPISIFSTSIKSRMFLYVLEFKNLKIFGKRGSGNSVSHQIL